MAFGQSIDQRKQNKRNHVVELFRRHGVLSKALARQLSGYSMDTLISLFKSLEDEGYIASVAKDAAPEPTGTPPASEARGKGRPAELYRLNEEKELYWGMTFNRNGIWSTLVGFGGTEIDARFDELDETACQADLEACLESHVAAFLEANKTRLDGLRRAGLSLPGSIDAERGVLSRYNLMPFLKDFDPRPILSRRIPGIPITVQHNITGLASMLLRDKELTEKHHRMLYVSARSGAAHALIQDGRIVIDDGEMGHLSVSSSRAVCRCGRVGCLDTVFSAAEFHRLCPHSSWEQLSKILESESPAADALKTVVEPPFEALAEALLNLAAAFAPDLIVLSGELFSILPAPADWVKRRISAVYGGNTPPWVPEAIEYRKTSAASAAIGLCRTLIDEDWPWLADQSC